MAIDDDDVDDDDGGGGDGVVRALIFEPWCASRWPRDIGGSPSSGSGAGAGADVGDDSAVDVRARGDCARRCAAASRSGESGAEYRWTT